MKLINIFTILSLFASASVAEASLRGYWRMLQEAVKDIDCGTVEKLGIVDRSTELGTVSGASADANLLTETVIEEPEQLMAQSLVNETVVEEPELLTAQSLVEEVEEVVAEEPELTVEEQVAVVEEIEEEVAAAPIQGLVVPSTTLKFLPVPTGAAKDWGRETTP